MSRSTLNLQRGLLFFTLLVFIVIPCQSAEYRNAESPAPRSADEVESTLDNITPQWMRGKRIVFDAIDGWRKQQAPFIRDGQTRFDFRTYSFDGLQRTGREPQSWVAGGELAYRSGKWRDILAIGASWYGSFEIEGNTDAASSGLIQTDGGNISVIGQAFAQLDWKGLQARLYRQGLDLPYINRNDIRQIPNTFEAYGIGRKGTALDFVIGHVDKIKRRTDDEFISMTEAAGGSGDAGTTVVGTWWTPTAHSVELGAVTQITENAFNTFYTEINWERLFTETMSVKLAGQYTDQRSVGADQLGDFKTDTWGARLSASYGKALFTLAFTQTDSGADIRSPFGGRPSYLSSMISNFDRANERAWRVGLSYHFDRLGLPGLSAFINVSKGRNAINEMNLQPLPAQTEYDYTVDFRPDRGTLEGFWLRVRYARLDENGSGKVADQIRIILNYSLPIL